MLSRVRYWFGAAVFFAIRISYCGLLPAQAGSPQDRSAAGTSRVATMRDLHDAATIPVTEYGAVGNCTENGPTPSCTDNANAIQNAIDHCYAAACAVYFPANPEGKKATIYYVSHAINPKGVSLYGPAGAAGSPENGLPSVGVRGAPGKDVFAVGDPSSTGYVAPFPRFAVRDLGIIVDSSVDASSSGSNSFPNRLPGRTVYDGTMTSSSAVLTSSKAKAYFQPGDLGQNIVVYGAGTQPCPQSGTSNCLITTISGYASATQVTLATTASATVQNAQVYISVMGLSATQTIGNCGFTMDASAYNTRAENPVGSTAADFAHVYIRPTSLSQSQQYNNQCGFFFQGGAAPYQDRWEHDDIFTEFGFVFVPANLVTAPGKMCAGICDYNVVDHTWIGGIYPWISYGGGENRLQDVQLSDINQGPNILAAAAPASWPIDWDIDIPEEEANWSSGHGCRAGWMTYRIAGWNHTISRLGAAYCTPPTSIGFEWDANSSRVDDFHFNSINPINITGSLNSFNSSLAWDTKGWNVTGYGNTFVTCAGEGAYEGVRPARCQYAGLNPFAVGPALLSRGSIAFNRTDDFIDKGASVYYLNNEDLWFWPPEVGAVSGAPVVVNDPESETGSAINLAPGTRAKILNESNGSNWIVGSQIPAGPMRIYFKAKTSGEPVDFYVDALYGDPTPTHSLGCHTTVTLKSAYGIFYCDVNTSGANGSKFGIQLGNGRPRPAHVEIAWIGIRPWSTDLPTASLQIGSGAAITGNQGNGSYLLHSTGSATPGDLIAFDNSGNAVDSGVPASRGRAHGGGQGGEADPASPGDLLCAHGGDKTIHSVPIIGSPVCNGTTCTLTGSAVPADYAIPGQLIGVAGTSGVAGLNGGPYQVTSYAPDSVAFSYTAMSGTPSGGAFYRWCENQDSDVTAMTAFSRSSISVPANSLEKDMNYQHRAQMLLTTAASAADFSIQMSYGPINLYRATLNTSASQINKPSQLTVNMLPLASGNSGVIESSLQSFTLSGSNSDYGDLDPGIQTVDTTVPQTIQVKAAFSATGIASIVSASGGSISGVGACKLTGFNGGGTGAMAAVTFTRSGSWSGTAFTVGDTGRGYNSAPTTAVLSSGTAKCSGIVALVTHLGGAQGNAVELVGLQ